LNASQFPSASLTCDSRVVSAAAWVATDVGAVVHAPMENAAAMMVARTDKRTRVVFMRTSLKETDFD
jgi:type IV secretory pathway TrbD component